MPGKLALHQILKSFPGNRIDAVVGVCHFIDIFRRKGLEHLHTEIPHPVDDAIGQPGQQGIDSPLVCRSFIDAALDLSDATPEHGQTDLTSQKGRHDVVYGMEVDEYAPFQFR